MTHLKIVALRATFYGTLWYVSVYKTKEFSKFARKADLGGAELLEAAKAVASGQSDADLGGGVFKQRIARQGGGKSGGFRTIILFKVG